MQVALLHKCLLFPAALVFHSAAVREVVHVSGRCTGYNWGRHAHHIHWTLKKCNDPCFSVFVSETKECFTRFMFRFFFFF